MYVRFCHNTINFIIILTTVASGLGAQNLFFFLAMSFFKWLHQLYDTNYHEALDDPQSHASTYFSYEF